MRNENSSADGQNSSFLKKLAEEGSPLGNNSNKDSLPKKDILEIPFRATVISSISATSYLVLIGIFFTGALAKMWVHHFKIPRKQFE